MNFSKENPCVSPPKCTTDYDDIIHSTFQEYILPPTRPSGSRPVRGHR